MIKFLALYLVRFYQRFISPYKGFSCAYRLHTGRAGCSQLGYRAIRRFGVPGGLRVLNRRLERCSEVYHDHCQHHHQHNSRPAMPAQRGFVDCGGCDVPSGGCDLPCDAASCDVATPIADCGSAVGDGVMTVGRAAGQCTTAGDCLSAGDCGGDCGSRRSRGCGRRRHKDDKEDYVDMRPPPNA